jgi:hypothetical protein
MSGERQIQIRVLCIAERGVGLGKRANFRGPAITVGEAPDLSL